MMKHSTPKLILMWSNPDTKENCRIGILSKTNSGYTFEYLKDDVQKAYDFGFSNLSGFPDLEVLYQSPKLFSVFERRIPSHSRKEFKDVVTRFNLGDQDDLDWEFLRITKGKLATDRLYFLEPIKIWKNVIELEFDLAGWKFTNQDGRLVGLVREGQQLELELDSTNQYDPKAIKVNSIEGSPICLGYVPKPYNEPLFFWMGKKIKFMAKVRTLLDETQQSRPVIQLIGKLPYDRNLKNFLPPMDEFIFKVDSASEPA